MGKEITSKLLKKIELYCILNNIDNWDNVPYHCFNCQHNQTNNCIYLINIYLFSCRDNYRKFQKGWERSVNTNMFTGCDKWQKK